MNCVKYLFFRSRRFAAAVLCLAAAAALILPTAVYAQEQAQKSDRVVRVGWFESPFNRMDKFGRRSGYAYDYQRKIAAYTGWTYEYVDGTWPELLEKLINGEIDMLSDVSFTEERAEKMLFTSLPMGSQEYYLFVRPGISGFASGRYKYFNGRRVGVNKGSIQAAYLRSWLGTYDIDAEIVELTCTAEEAFEMLNRGDLDGYVIMDAYGTTNTAVPEIRIGSSDFYFALSKDRSDLLKELDAALIRIQDENRFYSQELFQKYITTYAANLYLSSEESAWLTQHGTIRVGYQDDYLAFCAKDPDTGELTGALKDYLNTAADCLEKVNLDFEAIAFQNAEDAMEALKKGEVDCMFPSNLSIYDGELLGVEMTPPIMHAEVYALVREEDQKTFFRKEKENLTIAVEPYDINYHAIVRDLFPDWQMKEYPDTLSCLRAVSAGEADCYLTSNYQFNELRRECKKLELIRLATGKEADFSIAVSSGSRELYSILTKTLSFVSNTSMNAALTYYTAEGAKLSLAELLLENLFIVVGAVIVLAALILTLIFQRRMIVAQRKVNEQQKQLASTREMAFRDALTGVKSKHAYVEAEKQMDQRIADGSVAEFSVGVFDLNDLKKVNDTRGHDAGDQYIREACRLICTCFKRSPVYRIGGDEFAVILEGEDYAVQDALLSGFDRQMEENREQGKIVISTGISRFEPELDHSFRAVFERADAKMYQRKRALKGSVR